tara:strand:- start:8414 stop:9070 length:657 start_codon:yes stop_codon:yes gene_type:complete
MRKRPVIVITVFLLLTTITSQIKIKFPNFNIKKIHVENNFLLEENVIKKLLVPIYNQNLLFLGNEKIQNLLMQNEFIESFNVRKKYPDTLIIKIFEKKLIAILVYKKNRFYLSDKVKLVKFTKLQKYKDLPYVFGDQEKFKLFYKSLKKINFPLSIVTKYTLYESNRWDVETIDKETIKLPQKKYTKSLNNYLSLRKKNSFKKYKIYDYRIEGQLILK